MPRLSSIHRLLCELVEIPSINPRLLPDREDLTGEARVADFLAEEAKKLGISARKMRVLPGRSNLLLRLRPPGKVRQRVLLTPHLDVVPAEEKDFKATIKNGNLHGRGACDTKGSVASFFSAFAQIAQNGPRPKNTEIVFVGLVDEEFGQAGSRMLAQKGPKGDLAIAGEPTKLKVVSAHKGNLWIRLSTQGKAAHGSTPENGKNAIEAMTAVLQCLYSDYSKILAQKSHPLLGSPSLSIGRIKGGTQPNVIPNHCEIDLDRRTLPSETPASVKKELVEILAAKGLAPKYSNARDASCPALETDPSLPLAQSFLKAAKRRKSHGVPYFTDASPIAMGGTPALVYGPGNIAQAHSKDEWVPLKEVEDCRDAVYRFLKDLD